MGRKWKISSSISRPSGIIFRLSANIIPFFKKHQQGETKKQTLLVPTTIIPIFRIFATL